MSAEANVAGSKNVIITKKAREKLVKARAGAIVLPAVVGMVFGDGGIDSEGKVVPPAESQEALNHEIFRKEIDGYSFPEDTTCRYVCTLSDTELAGESLSEVGLYDAEGDIVCIKTFLAKGKDEDLEMTFTLDDIF